MQASRTAPAIAAAAVASSLVSHAVSLGPALRRPSSATNPATAASAPLRASVRQPTGAECSWPKQ